MSNIETVGATAGQVWSYLKSNGASSLSAIERGVAAPRTVVYMALGWLAREGKVTFTQENRAVIVSLREG